MDGIRRRGGHAWYVAPHSCLSLTLSDPVGQTAYMGWKEYSEAKPVRPSL